MSLLELQRAFLDHVIDDDETLAGRLDDDGKAGLAVYHNAFRAQLVECLRDSYERVAAWLGDEGFEAAARHHIAENPPTSWTLGDYGANLSSTLRALYPDDGEVADIAALDWALRRAFDGRDSTSVTPADLADVDWESAVITFVPTLSLLTVETNCAALWSAIAEGGTDIPPIEIFPAPVTLRIWRDEFQPRFATIDDDEVLAIGLAQSGMSFSDLCDGIAKQHGAAAATEAASRILTAWLGDGLIASIR